jgi:hypothetical protein
MAARFLYPGGSQELKVLWGIGIGRGLVGRSSGNMGQDPLPASRSCHGNHEGKEGMEWKVSRVPDHHGVAAHRPNSRCLTF